MAEKTEATNYTLTWEEFCEGITQVGSLYDFCYKDLFIQVWSETNGFFKKVRQWFFVTHKHNNTGNEIYCVYKNPQLLLQNARIDGKSLEEIWNELQNG
ncbi:MAG: hypothetical protein FWE97_04295 [Dehalococcoidia bacterium]|nr:hypothetical protein [Dehalococcoidia bacterium]